MLRDEGFNSGFAHDEGATSLLRTSNTIRWRYTDELDQDGARVPESNARIVRWSDGTMSLQVGSELFDITQQTEKGRVSVANTGANTPQLGASSQSAGPSSSQQLLSQATQSVPMGSSGSTNRPAQSLSYLVVPHEAEQVMEAQGPIAGSLAFTPADTQSETHRRIAKALRFQKTARVVATAAGEGALDPEIEKARIEKELKDAEKKRVRERQKADRKSGKFDDDMFDIESRRRSRYVGGRKLGAGPRNADYYSDDSDLGGGVRMMWVVVAAVSAQQPLSDMPKTTMTASLSMTKAMMTMTMASVRVAARRRGARMMKMAWRSTTSPTRWSLQNRRSRSRAGA